MSPPRSKRSCPSVGILDLILAEPGGRRAQMLPPEISRDDIIWYARLAELADWRGRHPAKWPSVASSDPEEKKIGVWLSTQKSLNNGRRKRGWPKERKDALDIQAPGWDARMNTKWEDVLDDLRVWRENNADAWPRVRSSDSEELRLGRWLSVQRNARNGRSGVWSQKREDAMESVVPGWDSVMQHKWEVNLSRLVQWRADNPGRWPRSGMRENSEENRLGRWLRYAVATLNGDILSARDIDRLARLNAAVPGWNRQLDTETDSQ